MKKLIIIIASLTATISVYAQNISPENAKDYVGKSVTVCGKVKSTYRNAAINGNPTFIDFGARYPHGVFTVVIWGSDVSKFKYKPDRKLRKKNVCVTGTVTSYKGKPEIVVHDPSQLIIK